MIRSLLLHNILLKVAAVAISVTTWAGVVYATNPPTTRSVAVHIPQDLSSVPAPYARVAAIPDVTVDIIGTRDHVDAFDVTSLHVAVSYSGITHAGLQSVPLVITNTDSSVDIASAPTSVLVDIDQLITATVQVQLVVTHPLPQGYVASATTLTPSTVTISGPRHELVSARAVAGIDLSNDKANVEADIPVTVVDSLGHTLTDVSESPPVVRVQTTVAATTTTKLVAVVPKVSGVVAGGYQLTSVVVSPSTVTLTGAPDDLNSLDSISTQVLNLSGLTADETLTLQIVVPSKVTTDPSTVTVTVSVSRVAPASPSPSPT